MKNPLCQECMVSDWVASEHLKLLGVGLDGKRSGIKRKKFRCLGDYRGWMQYGAPAVLCTVVLFSSIPSPLLSSLFLFSPLLLIPVFSSHIISLTLHACPVLASSPLLKFSSSLLCFPVVYPLLCFLSSLSHASQLQSSYPLESSLLTSVPVLTSRLFFPFSDKIHTEEEQSGG